MIVRRATESDLGFILRMGRDFFEVSGYRSVLEFDAGSFVRTVRRIMRSGRGVVLIGETTRPVGMAAGVLYPSYMNRAHLTGQELFWWVDPAARGDGRDLLAALEGWARRNGARSFTMGALAAQRPAAVGSLYARSGYRPMENLYVRRL